MTARRSARPGAVVLIERDWTESTSPLAAHLTERGFEVVVEHYPLTEPGRLAFFDTVTRSAAVVLNVDPDSLPDREALHFTAGLNLPLLWLSAEPGEWIWTYLERVSDLDELCEALAAVAARRSA